MPIKQIACLIAILILSKPAGSTTIIVVARNGRVYVGADGKRSGTAHNGHVAYPACKIQRFGGFLVAHYGGYFVQVKISNSDKFKTLIDTDEITSEAMRVPGSVLEKSESLDAKFWKAYKTAISSLPSGLSVESREKLRGELRSVAFVVVGPDMHRQPTAIILSFRTNFDDLLPRSSKSRIVVDEGKNRCLGFCDFANGVITDPFGPNTEETILTYLESAASLHPDFVGPPYSSEGEQGSN